MEDSYEPFVTPAQRKRNELLQKKRQKGEEPVVSNEVLVPPTLDAASSRDPMHPMPGESLLSIAKRLRKQEELDPEAAALKRQEEEEARLMESAMAATSQALISAKEHALDKKSQSQQQDDTPAVVRKWRPTQVVEDSETLLRFQKLMILEGKDIPQMHTTFETLNLNPVIAQWLATNKIVSPTPIQMQGLPLCLSGRDMIGVASTGSGKTLCFVIPAIMLCCEMEEETNRGPLALLLGPSRELQRQTFQICSQMLPHRCILAIGGESKTVQLKDHRRVPGRILVGTPGRVLDFLNTKEVSLLDCSLLVMDEGDRLIEEGFDAEIKQIIGHFDMEKSRQTILFSATMPRRVSEFASHALNAPVLVNVGRAGSASANITQHVEPVKKRDRFVLLLQALQRTEPPCLIFCSKNSDVEDVHLYLLLKGIACRAIHAQKTQQERNQAVDDFKLGLADVLVASDVGAKGLDFPNIRHVILFDLPTEIENYVHRIGRTGRGVGNTGMSTTFVDVESKDTTNLADLVGILRDARQRIPLFLMGGEVGKFEEPQSHLQAQQDQKTCSVCGGFGHRVAQCPKLAVLGKKGLSRDMVTGGDY